MLRTNSLRAAFFLPAAAVVALASLSGSAYAQTTEATQALLTIINTDSRIPGDTTGVDNDGFTDQKTTTGVGVERTLTQAAADDLVYAVYAAILKGADPVDVVGSALDVNRRDLNKVIARVVDAAILASNATGNDELAANIVQKAVQSDFASPAGKAAAIASGLRNTTTAGLRIGAVADAADGTGAAALKFQTTVLKLVGGDTTSVPAYVDRILDTITTANTPAAKADAAVALAKGVKKLPGVLGDLVQGATLDRTGGAPTAGEGGSDNDVILLVSRVLALKPKGIPEVVAGGLTNLSSGTSLATAADRIADTAKLSIPNRAFVASGALVAFTATGSTNGTVSSILDTLAGPSLSTAAVLTFVRNAATRNETLVRDVVDFAVSRGITDTTNLAKTGTAIINGISFTAPSFAENVALKLTELGVFSGPSNTAARENLAAALAVGSKRSLAAAGSAVAGVIRGDIAQSGTADADRDNTAVRIAAVAIKRAPKAAVNIAFEASQVPNVAPTPESAVQFTKDLSQQTPKSVGQVAAGVAAANIESAGQITASVVTNAKNALSISKIVANVVDTEGISQIGASVGALVGTGKAIPSVSTLTSLASTLTKAINAKPIPTVGRKEFTWQNRVDELGELAAVLTTAAINASSTANAATRASTLAAIGNSIFKSVSKKLMINAGNMLADINDVARQVAGSIFQVIENSGLSQDDRDDLLADDGALIRALTKGKKGFALAEIKEALKVVNDTAAPNAFQTGSTYDPETPVKNL